MEKFESTFFALHPVLYKDNLEESLDSLNYLLKSAGAKAEIVTSKNNNEIVLLHISCDKKDFSQKAKRCAGRKEVFNYQMTVGEAMDLRATHTMDEIARIAGISRRTLYRKLEKYKDMRDITL